MTINFIYILVILIAMYFSIKTYIHTKENLMLWTLAILLASFLLELQWMNLGNYVIDITDTFWTTRDIAWTIITILLFNLAYKSK